MKCEQLVNLADELAEGDRDSFSFLGNRAGGLGGGEMGKLVGAANVAAIGNQRSKIRGQ